MERISKATKKNWERLKIDENKKVLEHRANKRMSKKRIIPKELFKNKKNVKEIFAYISYIDENYDIKNDIEKIMRTFCIKWLMQNELVNDCFVSSKKNVQKFIKENNDIYVDFLQFNLPEDEQDILGILYQCLQTEGDKNKIGSYYTSKNIVRTMVSRMIIDEETKILDPCCGTGAFLLESNVSNPLNLWGIDIDNIAIMIVKVNLFIKFKDIDFYPNIYCFDFLNKDCENKILEKFDYIITNPPWGADCSYVSETLYREIKSKESFSYMIVKSKEMLKNNGKLLFLLPESFLNVKVHRDIRQFVIERMKLEEIILYPSNFSGVQTNFISIEALNVVENEDYEIMLTDLNKEYILNAKTLKEDKNFVISILAKEDKSILNKIFSIQYNTLEESIWGLGIVTGDNGNKLKSEYAQNLEPIYTGKEITEYRLMPCTKYIEYKREEFQQVAPDRIYRAPEKLVYKFISKNITFAYDNKQSLVLNSANILIPNLDTISIKASLAFLNSNLFKYIYRKKFGEIKILKGNLMQLPFPIITKEENNRLEELVDRAIQREEIIDVGLEINSEIYKIFNLNDNEIEHIEKSI